METTARPPDGSGHSSSPGVSSPLRCCCCSPSRQRPTRRAGRYRGRYGCSAWLSPSPERSWRRWARPRPERLAAPQRRRAATHDRALPARPASQLQRPSTGRRGLDRRLRQSDPCPCRTRTGRPAHRQITVGGNATHPPLSRLPDLRRAPPAAAATPLAPLTPATTPAAVAAPPHHRRLDRPRNIKVVQQGRSDRGRGGDGAGRPAAAYSCSSRPAAVSRSAGRYSHADRHAGRAATAAPPPGNAHPAGPRPTSDFRSTRPSCCHRSHRLDHRRLRRRLINVFCGIMRFGGYARLGWFRR